MPTTPNVRPARSWPRCPSGSQVLHFSESEYWCPSTTRRAAAMRRQNAMSAVASVRTPGVLPTQTPRAVAAGTSTLLNPTAKLLTTRRRGAASSSCASIRSVSNETRPSQSATLASSVSRGGGRSSGQTSASVWERIRSCPVAGRRRVTNTFGAAGIGEAPRGERGGHCLWYVVGNERTSGGRAMSTLRDHALEIWHAAVAAADPFERIRSYLSAPDSPERTALGAGGGVLGSGSGKAGPVMARGVEAALAADLDRVSGVLNVPAGELPKLQRIDLWPARPAGSNHPTDEGVRGTDMQLAMAELLRPVDLALCLFSGGGSALLPAPVEGVSLLAKQEVTRLLHACGATINEMNCVRKHLSRYKGGRLAQVFAECGCRAVSLIVSDVVGDPLDVIASGPTAADPTTCEDALAVLKRYQLTDRVPASVNQHLERGAAGTVADTPKTMPASVENVVLCNNAGALAAATVQAEQLGYRVLNLGSFVEG